MNRGFIKGESVNCPNGQWMRNWDRGIRLRSK